ncbi:MAG: glycosyltransferase family 9 protein [Ignavibacteriaceae bacterium]|nr:glycosyltransferase family 9 protein [Ignavibacteriaceae bacterium]
MELKDLNIPRCKNFTGYKPCYSYKNCLENGCQADITENHIGIKILIISLEALGAVLNNTGILPAIKRKFPESTIYWLTLENAEKLLYNNKVIDRLFIWNEESRMILRNIEFEYVMNSDKSDYACAFANEINAKTKLGFRLNADGKIIPANKGAIYSYIIGNDDQLKFRDNKRTGLDILHEAFKLEYCKDEYLFEFDDEEKLFMEKYKQEIKYDPTKKYIGLNTGCSQLFPNKKMTIKQHVELINELGKDEDKVIVLLGGREDSVRNEQILELVNKNVKHKVISTPTTLGLRRGACFMDICDLVITGDSLGMHMAIALKKYVIVWFGLSCEAEIELYGRGEKLIPEGLECSPCWKKVCPYNLECIDIIDLNKITTLTREFKKG